MNLPPLISLKFKTSLLSAKSLFFLLFLVASLTTAAQGLKRSGQKMVDQNGNEVILRGMGLGGWMLQEPYMMEMSGFTSAQWEIKSKIQGLIGQANTEAFYDAWHASHCSKRDIDSLAAWGFNSVRLPMHYNLYTLPIEEEPVAGEQTWLEKGFALTDSLVKWCAANHIYVILDLHAAPGGQGKDYAISDGNPAKPSLWESDANKQKTIALWKKLAQRYVTEAWIGAYDLINEPNWSFTAGGNQNGCSETSNVPLRQLYIDITNAIREVDQNHMIIIEGNCWGNNYNGVLPAWDNNMALSFHKYWSYNDQNSIQGIINLRNQHNLPIWLGESGENSNAWFTDAIKLVEKNKIGWAWWPMKKIGSVVGPLTITKTAGYQSLLDYWNNGGTQPSAASATYTLMQIASNANIGNCTFHKDVIDAMFRQVQDSTTLPFANHRIPGVINASNYNLGRYNKAYWDKDIATYHVSAGTYTAWNSGWAYRNDGVDIEASADAYPSANGYNVGWIADKEWLQYTVEVDSSAAYLVQFRYAAATSGSVMKLKVNETDVSPAIILPATGGNQSWNNAQLSDVILYKGQQKLKVYFEKGGMNFGLLNFSISKQVQDVALKALTGETYLQTEAIIATFNKMLLNSTVGAEGFSCTVNGSVMPISYLGTNPLNPFQVVLNLAQPIIYGDDIKLHYSNGLVKATDGSMLENFFNLPIKNNLPPFLTIPGKIEAEAFSVNQGLQLETTTDIGGGQNVGFTNAGDYLEYLVKVQKTATYKVEVRIACQSQAGKIQMQQINNLGIVLNAVDIDIPVTGGWQSWQSIFAQVHMDEGFSTLKVKILQPEFNMNWYKFTEKIIDTIPVVNTEIKIYPNPAKDIITIETPGSAGLPKKLLFRTLNGVLAKETSLSAADEIHEVYVGTMVKGFYLLELEIGGEIRHSKLIIE